MPAHHHLSARGSELRTLRLRLLRLRHELGLIRREQHHLKYNPNQPRVPAGGAGGGRWTSGTGGGGGLAAGIPGSPGFGTAAGAAEGAAEGEAGWSSLGEGWSEDGSVFEQAVTDGAGTTIQSEYAASREVSFDERQTVTGADGGRFTFETTGRTQTIRDGGPDGEVVSKAVWTPDGPEPIAEIVEARWGRNRGSGSSLSQAADRLFDFFNTLGNATGLQTVLGFRAHDYAAGQAGSFDVTWVGRVDRAEVEQACPYLPKIQEMLDDAAREAGPPSNFATMQKYGTDVHLRLKRKVDAWRNPDVFAERSYFKERQEMGEQTYATAGTARFDVYENGPNGTRCLYDIKVGRGLSRTRSDTLADAAMRIYGIAKRLIVIELRPRQ